MDLSTTFRRPSLSAEHSSGSVKASSSFDSDRPQNESAPPFDFNQDGLSNRPGDYFGTNSLTSVNPFEKENPFNATTSGISNQGNASQAHPWSNLFQSSGPPTAAPQPVSTPMIPSMSRTSQASTSSHQSTNHKNENPMLFMPLKAMQRKQSGGSTASAATAASLMTAEDLARYEAMEADELIGLLHSSNIEGSLSSENILIIDIRPSTSFALSRIRGSVNVCAPSTLLKRSGVTVDRIEEEMLYSEQDQTRFSGWKKGPQKSDAGNEKQKSDAKEMHDDTPTIECIVVLDTDTRHVAEAGKPASGGGGPCLTGLLRKFDQAGYAGRLRWLVGGFFAFSSSVNKMAKSSNSSESIEKLLDHRRPSLLSPSKSSDSAMQAKLKMDSDHHDNSRRASAPHFQNPLGITNRLKSPPNGQQPKPTRTHSLVHPIGLPMEAFSASSTSKGKFQHEQSLAGCEDTDDKNEENSAMSAANPFFDNIRQNKELQNGITERIPLQFPPFSEGEARRLPHFLAKLRKMDEKERANGLAESFFSVEEAERDRLMATMQRHVDESDCHSSANHQKGTSPKTKTLGLSSAYNAISTGQQDVRSMNEPNFPFSIAAALERGGENRYNNIWTYEHSRVQCPKHADYLNASYIEPARQFGCKRRYIATQAPLPSTFETFWSVLWQQNVRTICMVTREFESGRVQSHNYWQPRRYGEIDLQIVEEVALSKDGNVVKNFQEKEIDSSGDCGNYFNLSTVQTNANEEYATIRRKFNLANQNGERRVITQFQYIGWPDYSVPDEPESLLVLMRMANTSQVEADREAKLNRSTRVGPIVVHCSAGVGRTGTYVVIDSVLDVVRRVRWAAAGRQNLDTWEPGWIGNVERGRETSPKSEQKSTFRFDQNLNLGRKSLKREFSPGDMNNGRSSISPSFDGVNGIDDLGGSMSNSTHSSISKGRDIDSPPPARRNRSDSTEGGMSSASVTSSPTNLLSLNLPPASIQQQNRLPFAFGNSEGPQTPSTALGKLSLSSNSNTPIHRTRRSSKPAILSSSSQQDSSYPNTKSTSNPVSSSPSKDDDSRPSEQIWNDVMGSDGIDLVRVVVDTIREQRMSMVQTNRQFVFAYRTILTGILQEIRREQAALERVMSP